MSSYADLNPFISTSVGENDLWNAAAFLDVPYIHSVPFGALRIAVDQVRAQHRSQVRFVRGAGGSGKSHLFSRLRRECADSIFYAYAPNPPLQPEALENFILTRFVGSLRHPARSKEGEEAPYSQLRLLAYALLKPVVEQDFTFPELHEAWATIGLDTRKEMIHQAVQLLEADHPMVPRSVLRCLLSVLRDDKEHLAAQWLSGAAYLTENELKYLGVVEPLARSDMGGLIQLFGKLASQAGSPAVLVLDQLDLVVSQPQLDEMQRLLFALIDQSQNWVVLIGLVAERFAAWDAALTQALRGRIGVPDSNAPLGFRLPVIDMLPIANEQKRLLLNCRLETPALIEQRQKDGIPSSIHPLLEEDITRLTSGGAIFPRHLLAAAAEAYATRTTQSALPPEVVAAVAAQPVPPPLPAQPAAAPAMPVALAVAEPAAPAAPVQAAPPAALPALAALAAPKNSLAEKVDVLFQEAVSAAKAETSAPSSIDLGERTRDLIELMVAPRVTITEGDIRKTYDNFDGSDRWFEWGGGKVRVVTSDAMRGSLIAVLERIKEAAGDTLLLRNYFAPVSGQLTMELLNTFKSKNTFHHIPASEAAVLAALGSMLAAQREGSYDHLSTEPPATRDNVLAALRAHPLLRGLRFWEMIQKVHAPKAAPPGPPQSSVLSSIIRPSAPPAVKPPAIPAATPPVVPVAVPPPVVTAANPTPVPVATPPAGVPAANPPPIPVAMPPPIIPAAALPPAPVAKPPAFPGAKPPPPPAFTGATKPLGKPPSAPVSKPIAKPPAPPMMKPPAAKLPPPSQGTAA